MNYNNLPEEVKNFIKNVEELRNLQKRFFLATTRNTVDNHQRIELLKECKKQESQIDQTIINLKSDYTQLKIV